ncbi:zinc finger protein 346-like [Pogoniulus pusillus]|uniref:zinc finger protein 346-like n=1 Tax=Pogoniulus pusillus TaxID=488313 RepID=UPI0030B95828
MVCRAAAAQSRSPGAGVRCRGRRAVSSSAPQPGGRGPGAGSCARSGGWEAPRRRRGVRVAVGRSSIEGRRPLGPGPAVQAGRHGSAPGRRLLSAGSAETMPPAKRDGQAPVRPPPAAKVDWSGGVGRHSYCNPCDMFCPHPVAALSHCFGKIHSKKVKQSSGDQGHLPAQPALQKPETPLLPSTAEESSSSSNTLLPFKDSDKYCKLCCAPLADPFVAQAHYGGKRHRKNEARRKILEELGEEAVPAELRMNVFGLGYYSCQVCNVTVTTIETFLSHVRGSKHQINLCRKAVLGSQQPAACEQTGGETPNRHGDKGYSEEKQVSEVATVRQESFNLPISESKDGFKLLFADAPTSFCRVEEKIQIKIEKEN